MSHSVQRRWYPIAFAIAALVLLPLSVLLLSWHEVDGSTMCDGAVLYFLNSIE